MTSRLHQSLRQPRDGFYDTLLENLDEAVASTEEARDDDTPAPEPAVVRRPVAGSAGRLWEEIVSVSGSGTATTGLAVTTRSRNTPTPKRERSER